MYGLGLYDYGTNIMLLLTVDPFLHQKDSNMHFVI
jgi:hypothetical protein